MKKKIRKRLILLGVIILMCGIQFLPWQELKVTANYTTLSTSAEYSETLYIETNMIFLSEEKLGEMVVERFIENNLEERLFLFEERGYPSELYVYIERKIWGGIMGFGDMIEVRYKVVKDNNNIEYEKYY